MAITNGYTTLAALRAKIGYEESGTLKHDAALENLITAVSRWIDQMTNRRFYATTETRYYTAEWFNYCRIDDLLTLSSLKTDEDGDRTFEITWASTDYDLDPINAPLDNYPYTGIRVAAKGVRSFPISRDRVEVVGSFGYSTTTPMAVEQACLIACMRVWERNKMVYGVTAGGGDLGTKQVISVLSNDGEILGMLGAIPMDAREVI